MAGQSLILKIIDEKTVTLRSIKLNSIIFTEFLDALLGQTTLYGLFNMTKDIDHTTKEGKKEIISKIYEYIHKNYIENSILLSAYPQNLKLEHKITKNVIISGKDLFGRNLNFVFNEETCYLAHGEWETFIEKSDEKNHFKFNSLGKKELILSKKQNPNKSDYIILSELDIINLEEHIKTVVIKCSFETNRILFRYFTYSNDKNKVENIENIDIVLPVISNYDPLVVYIPYKKEELKWDVNGTNFIIYSSGANKNKKFTILDAFNKDINKEVIICAECTEPYYNEEEKDFTSSNGTKMDLISFMKEIAQYTEDEKNNKKQVMIIIQA